MSESADIPQKPSQEKIKKPYVTPILECFGSISNFTTGGSTKKTEWKYKSGSSSMSSMMGMGSSGGTWTQSMSKKKNVVKS